MLYVNFKNGKEIQRNERKSEEVIVKLHSQGQERVNYT